MQLGEAVEFLDSMRCPVTESARRPGPYPYYGANGQQGTIDDYIFDEPLVLLAEDGGHFDEPEKGIAYRITGKTWVNNHAHVLRPNSNVDLAFLCRVLENYDATPFVTGTTRGKLTQADATEILIPLPPLSEQRRIADILDRAEELRVKRRAALAQLDTLTQAIFLDLFGDPVTNPKGWERKYLGEIASKITDGEHLNPLFSPVGMPMIMAGNVLDDAVDLQTAKTVDLSLGERYRKKCDPEKGDLLLVSRGATIGRLCSIEITDRFCLMGSVILIKPNVALLGSKYLSSLLKHPLMRAKLYKTSGSSAQQAIYLKDLTRLNCPLPPLTLQREFAHRVTDIEKLKNMNRASLDKLDELFSSLQRRSFRGEL